MSFTRFGLPGLPTLPGLPCFAIPPLLPLALAISSLPPLHLLSPSLSRAKEESGGIGKGARGGERAHCRASRTYDPPQGAGRKPEGLTGESDLLVRFLRIFQQPWGKPWRT